VSAYTQLTRQPDNESQHLRCIIRADNSHVHTIETCLAMMSIEWDCSWNENIQTMDRKNKEQTTFTINWH